LRAVETLIADRENPSGNPASARVSSEMPVELGVDAIGGEPVVGAAFSDPIPPHPATTRRNATAIAATLR
jgi:hypothetical protein